MKTNVTLKSSGLLLWFMLSRPNKEIKMVKKIIKFENKKTGKLNLLIRAIEIPVTTRKNKLIPLITLNFFRRKKNGK